MSDKKKRSIFALVAVGIFMCTLDGSIVNITLPVIMRDLKTSLALIEWVVLIYLFIVASLLLSFGRLSDIKGRRWIYTRGLFLFTAGSLLCGMSTNVSWLILSRFFQGVGASMVMACSSAIIVDIFHKNERGRVLGMIGAVVALGLSVGPALGGSLLHWFSWRVIFYINIPIGLAASFAAAKLLKGGKTDIARKEAFDWAGGSLLALCLGSFLFAFTHGYDWGYSSIEFILMLLFSIITLAGVVIIETHVKFPIIEPSLLKIRLFTLPLLSAAIIFASLFIIVFLMPFYLMHPGGYSVGRAAYIMVTLFIPLLFVSPVAGSISDRIGSRLLCTFGMGILCVSFLCLSWLPPAAPPSAIAWRLALAGTGTAVFLSPNSAITMNSVPQAFRGIAAATIAMARNFGMVLGVAIAGTIFNSVFYNLSGGFTLKVYKPELQEVFMAAFHYAMTAGVVLAGIGIFVAFSRGPE
ncbi:MAG: MFS transporter [Deltaproteobacteria bacterium]|nr:MFS transporter [Deltaproteobacteria bacterium]